MEGRYILECRKRRFFNFLLTVKIRLEVLVKKMEVKLLQTISAIVFANRALRPGGTYRGDWDLSQPTFATEFADKKLLKVSAVLLSMDFINSISFPKNS